MTLHGRQGEELGGKRGAASHAHHRRAPTAAAGTVRIGVVVDYDAERGLGTIDAGDGLMVSFHCVDIADGTRHVALGSVVAFEVAPGHRGQPEARHVMVPAARAHVASPARSDDER